MRPAPVPQRGDLVWLDFTPQAGHEQAGRRPALILSPADYNRKTGLALACPVTTQAKGYPFEVPLPPDSPITGVILADHLRNIDWRARHATRIHPAPEAVTAEVLGKLLALLSEP